MEKKTERKRQVHASAMRATRSFFHNADDDDAVVMRTREKIKRIVCIQAVRWMAGCCRLTGWLA